MVNSSRMGESMMAGGAPKLPFGSLTKSGSHKVAIVVGKGINLRVDIPVIYYRLSILWGIRHANQ